MITTRNAIAEFKSKILTKNNVNICGNRHSLVFLVTPALMDFQRFTIYVCRYRKYIVVVPKLLNENVFILCLLFIILCTNAKQNKKEFRIVTHTSR